MRNSGSASMTTRSGLFFPISISTFSMRSVSSTSAGRKTLYCESGRNSSGPGITAEISSLSREKPCDSASFRNAWRDSENRSFHRRDHFLRPPIQQNRPMILPTEQREGMFLPSVKMASSIRLSIRSTASSAASACPGQLRPPWRREFLQMGCAITRSNESQATRTGHTAW